MLVSPQMARRWMLAAVFLLCLSGSAFAPTASTRYRVEQVVRLETTSSLLNPSDHPLWPQPVTSVVEGRVRFVLEQRASEPTTGGISWRFTQVEVGGPRTDPPEAAHADVEAALALGLNWMRQLEGQDLSGTLAELPVFPLGEAPPGWLTTWLRWAQSGSFAPTGKDPAGLPAGSYEVEWIRSESRPTLCHVQRARWRLPVAAAPEAVSASLAAEGVEARTHFAAQSLEWVAQDGAALVYAERSGVRETFWDLGKVTKPALRDLVFRLRLAIEVRLERLP